MASPVWTEPELAADDIQGNVVPGFNTRFQRLVGFRIEDVGAARTWMRARKDDVATLAMVADVRGKRRDHHRQESPEAEPPPPPRTLLNLALSYHGLKKLIGDRTEDIDDPWFKAGMWKVAATLGDDPSEMGGWKLGNSEHQTPDVLAILGDDDERRLETSYQGFVTEAGAARLTKQYDQPGARIPMIGPADTRAGFCEHFGFRDGISVPAVRGVLPGTGAYLYKRQPESAPHYAKPGQVLVWPGQLIFGYEAQDPDDPLRPAARAGGGSDWMKNGSFLVFRRLRQDVEAFRAFADEQAARPEFKGLGAARLRAMLVGRWPSGTPLVVSPDADRPYDQVNGNNFGFACDLEGRRCPVIAHVRKVNPRHAPSDLGGASRALALQIFRRGIPWGSPYDERPSEDRGLLFLAYTTAIEERFGQLQRWMNRDDAPEHGRRGVDLLTGQSRGARAGHLPVGSGHVNVKTHRNWVIPTGGGFFFSPSLSLLDSGFTRR